VLHRTDRVAVSLGNSYRIFEESKQTVAAHIQKIMGNVGVGRRPVPMRMFAPGGREGVRNPCTIGIPSTRT
jgi:hypothetical protein